MAKYTFEEAIDAVEKLSTKPSNDNLLRLYGLFKIGKGEDITKAPAPGWMDLKGKAKRNAWQELVDEGIDQEAAKAKYVELVEALENGTA